MAGQSQVALFFVGGAFVGAGARPDETAFMLAEIALSCGRVKPPSVPGALPPETVRDTGDS